MLVQDPGKFGSGTQVYTFNFDKRVHAVTRAKKKITGAMLRFNMSGAVVGTHV
jgi:hypothetical protein